jgi:hypothetical protein
MLKSCVSFRERKFALVAERLPSTAGPCPAQVACTRTTRGLHKPMLMRSRRFITDSASTFCSALKTLAPTVFRKCKRGHGGATPRNSRLLAPKT